MMSAPLVLRGLALTTWTLVRQNFAKRFQVRTLAPAGPRSFSATPRRLQDEPVANDVVCVSHEQLLQQLADPATVVVDVRNPHELTDTGMIPGTINIPLPILAETLDLPDEQFEYLYGVAKPKPSTEIIFSCRMGIRSVTAINIASQKGFQRLSHYPGGWLGWAEKQGTPNK